MPSKLNFKTDRPPLTNAGEKASHAFSHSALRTPHSALICLFAFLALFASNLFAQAPQSRPPRIENRFLFIIDTSSAMKKQQDEVMKIVADLLSTSANGQMRPGDSLGLWTFNQDVYSDLPAQTLTPQNHEQVMQRTLDFLKNQRYEKNAHLNKALADMEDVVHASDIITVFLISTGHNKISGTPFDDDINALYKQTLEDMGRSPKPVVTVLQGREGKLARFTVSAPPWPIVVPEIPIPIRLAQNQPVQKPVERPHVAQPLIISNSTPPTPLRQNQPPAKTALIPQPATTNASAPSLASNSPAVQSQASNPPLTQPAPVPTPTISAPPPQVPVSSAPPVVTPQTTSTPPPSFAQNAPPPSPAQTAPTPKPPNPPAPVHLHIVPTPTNEAAVVASNAAKAAPISNAAATPVIAKSNIAPAPIVAASNTVSPNKTAPSNTDRVIAPPAKPAGHSWRDMPTNQIIAFRKTHTNALTSRAVAFVQPPGTPGRSKALLIAAIALMLVGVFLVLLLIRRSRPNSSLITETMGNDKGR